MTQIRMQSVNRTQIHTMPDPVSPSESEALNHDLLEMSPFPISITTIAEGRFLMVNSMWCKMGGFCQNDVIGRTLDELGLFADPDEHKAISDALACDGEVKNFPSRVHRNGLSATNLNLWIRKIRYQGQDCALTTLQYANPEIAAQQTLRQNDMRFHTLLSQIQESYYEMDLKGNFTFFNDSLSALFGAGADTLKGMNIKSYTSDEDARKMDRSYEAILSARSHIEFIEFELRRKDGKILQVEASASPLKSHVGRTIGFYGIVRDRTEQKRTEDALRTSEEKLRRILDGMEEGYYETNLDGDFTYFNAATIKIHGYPPEKLMGMNFRNYMNPEQARKVDLIFKDLYKTGDAILIHDYDILREDGSVRLLEISGYPLRDAQGSIIGFWGITRNRTEQKRAEIEIRRSEEKYRRILEEMEEGYYETDLKGNLIYFNKAVAQKYGYSTEELLGMNYRTYLSPEEAQKISQLFTEVYKTGNSVKITDHELLAKDGSVSMSEISGYPLRDHQNEIIGFWGISRDRTQQKLAEMALKKSEEQYRLLVNNANDAIYITQEDLIKYHNPKTVEITGYSSEELGNLSFVDLIHPKDKEAVYDVQHRKLAKGEIPEVFTFRLLDKTKRLLWVELNAIGITWEGRPATLNFLRDVTQLKKTEHRLLQAQKMEAIGTLAGGVAHDFNNILSAIIGYSELARDDADKGSLQETNLNAVLVASHRARDLVHQILAFARQSEENLAPVIVNIIAKEALKLMRSSLPTTIEIRSNIASKSAVMGNSTQIHQIIMNLCTNAAQAMESSGGVLTLEMTDIHIPDEGADSNVNLKAGGYLKLTVADTGCGIAPEIINNIFDPYFTTKGLGEGTGMGLSVVQGIVEKYGGKISVESKLGQGSAFSVYLPICKVGAGSNRAAQENIAAQTARILLVDDELPIVDMATQILKRTGYRVTAHTNSQEALKLFAARPDDFDLVITDMTMPHMTGDQLAAEMMRIRPGIPVILCTGYSKKINEESSRKAGIKAFVYKPITRSQLTATIGKVLDGNDGSKQ